MKAILDYLKDKWLSLVGALMLILAQTMRLNQSTKKFLTIASVILLLWPLLKWVYLKIKIEIEKGKGKGSIDIITPPITKPSTVNPVIAVLADSVSQPRYITGVLPPTPSKPISVKDTYVQQDIFAAKKGYLHPDGKYYAFPPM